MSVVDLQASAQAGKLVIVCGAGTSISLAGSERPAPSWPTLVRSGLNFGHTKGVIDSGQLGRWKETAKSNDTDDLLSAAQFVLRKLGGRNGILYARWLEQEFSDLSPQNARMRDAIAHLCRHSLPICTVNYDTLIEACGEMPSLSFRNARSVMEWARRETTGVLHLHGVWNDPSTCVLGASDYDEVVNDEFRGNLQRSLSSFNRLLFLGCGDTLKDPNFSNLISWIKHNVGAAALQHYALVRDVEAADFHKQALYQGFVEPISYGSSFDDLPAFLNALLPNSSARTKNTLKPVESSILEEYRKYVIRDCGQMTIEGIRADADTAKQKFDIEKLFVPLAVDSVPPDIPLSDPQREEKLRQWEEETGGRSAFGDALRSNKRLALLALPGGGKTLLLKRLAVAYADQARRTTTEDRLPKADLLPILIRCREWRDHIRLPISSIIDRIGEITGRPEVNGLYAAAKERFGSGKILLLVDGLDEIHSDADRTIFVEHLEEFLSGHPKIRLVVTSREAGFSLVAPNIMRFCSRWRIAPLDRDAIRLLCAHWHKLMAGNDAEAGREAEEVVQTILASPALKRLAENPLLLTMLLVVKHGYGRLPPDRVSLYERAVEVLLDTWNIKGHDALNPKEAVPQLAYVALRMMREGRQTVTERELLRYLEDGRERVNIVRLYAKDAPQDFLKRVELRSSLLFEGGRIVQSGKAVPFYQFRHLTFQEYLAAVAAVEGHYDDYIQGNSPLVPLRQGLLSDDWKEVVPMAAVLARKQAEPLLKALVDEGVKEERQALETSFSDAVFDWSGNYRMPAPVSRLAQCLVEEAEFSPPTLESSIRLVATFAHGCQKPENWSALAKGPFGEALVDEAWRLFTTKGTPRRTWLRNTVAVLHGLRMEGEGAVESLERQLEDRSLDRLGRAAATVCGMMWLKSSQGRELFRLMPLLERGLDLNRPEIFEMTAWAISRLCPLGGDAFQEAPVSPSSLDALVSYWEEERRLALAGPQIGDFSLARVLPFERGSWKPELSESSCKYIDSVLSNERQIPTPTNHVLNASSLLAYHARDEFSESLTKYVARMKKRRSRTRATELILRAFSVGESIDNADGRAPK